MAARAELQELGCSLQAEKRSREQAEVKRDQAEMTLQAEAAKRRAAEAQLAALRGAAQPPARAKGVDSSPLTRAHLEAPGAEAPAAEEPPPRAPSSSKEKLPPAPAPAPAPAPVPAPAVSVVTIQSAPRKTAPPPKPPATALAAKLGAMDWD